MAKGEGATVRVTLLYSPSPRCVHECSLTLPDGATPAQALEASGWAQRFPELHAGEVALGIWGRLAEWASVLRDRDRLEFYRPLRVDPKVARRERFSKQGARTSGLFARQRPGGKAGY